MSDVTTVKLADGKYEFDLRDGLVVAARRHGVDWPAGMGLRYANCFVAALSRVAELDTERARIAKYIRDVGENECGFSEPECELLAERIEQGLHLR